MAPPVEISIPSTSLSTATSKPYTLYNITLRLPLRTFVVQKRYSEFSALDAALRSLVSMPPPIPLPGKSWFSSTASSPELTEKRREGLEAYLRAIAESADRRWRDTTVWRAFLNLPSNTLASCSSKVEPQANVTAPEGTLVTADPTVWLDVHREMKGQLHDARLYLGKRDSAATAQGQYEAGANAKRCLVKSEGLIESLEQGLKTMSGHTEHRDSGKDSIGEGELRRRKDLLAHAKVEKEGLEKLALSLAVKDHNSGKNNGTAVATQQDKTKLFELGTPKPSGRVLGAPLAETKETRELDNEGVLQLQRQMMRDQDLNVEELAKIVRRQKEMGLAIHDELDLQNEMLHMLDQDVSRVNDKVNIAKKRVGKIK